jgi:hypothetical protein
MKIKLKIVVGGVLMGAGTAGVLWLVGVPLWVAATMVGLIAVGLTGFAIFADAMESL